jgi:hypothetical protein
MLRDPQRSLGREWSDPMAKDLPSLDVTRWTRASTHGEVANGSGGLDVDEVLLEVDDGLLDLGGRGGGKGNLQTRQSVCQMGIASDP